MACFSQSELHWTNSALMEAWPTFCYASSAQSCQTESGSIFASVEVSHVKKSTRSTVFRSITAILPLTFYSAAAGAQTASVTVIYNFAVHHLDGASPNGPVIFDATGNLYGVTLGGGSSYQGTVFELSQNADGVWTEKVLHSFSGEKPGDVAGVAGTLALDAAGNLYGTTQVGGEHNRGTVFELSPSANGTWTETVLYSFAGRPDGSYPSSGIAIDSAGNLYGTTNYGGTEENTGYSGGTVFELTPQEGGGWKESILHSFASPSSSVSGLTMDDAGNLYGTANGIEVFRLSKPESGEDWTYTSLHTFAPADGDCGDAASGVILDADGDVYGATVAGGTYNLGCVFEVPAGQGANGSDTVLRSFHRGDNAGYALYGGLTFDHSGNLYGTTSTGGTHNWGKIFKLSPNGDGTWMATTLHDFNGQDGAGPETSMTLGPDGDFYGTTFGGGTGNAGGTVFKMVVH
jgi:uncharacterized repeat protein (TIGR03803 family)